MEIKPHTIQKHRVLGGYFKLIRDLINSNKNSYNKLYYADLYCGDGKCHVEAMDKTYNAPIIESLLKHAKRGFPLCCFLNDFDPEKVKIMKEHTKEYSGFIDGDVTCEDANKCYTKILEKIPKHEFSIFFLDPTNHADLKWDTVKGISECTSEYRGEVRRPELIINVMTYSMLQSFKAHSYESITESLGTDKWKEEIKKNKKNGIKAPVQTAFLNTYIRQLESLGYKVPPPIHVSNTGSVYHLVWATNQKGYDIITTDLVDWMEDLIEKTKKESYAQVSKTREKRSHNKFIQDYY
jgi:three-Cys-motif partner protein